MIITTGLEDNNYCVHTPIPVTVRYEGDISLSNQYAHVSVKVNGVDLFFPYPKIYSKDNIPRLDLAPWVKLGMVKFQDLLNYTTTLQTAQSIYQIQMQVGFEVCGDVDGSPGVTTCDSITITKTFVNCALASGRLTGDQRQYLKVWRGYPFSWLVGANRSRIIPNTSTPPAISGKTIEYIQDNCQGTYIKWLNEYGSYNYWLFPHSRQFVRDGSEYYRTPADIFDPNDKFINEYTVGFEVAEKLTVRDIINKKYWDTIKSLVGSPEVYMLKNDYVPGTTVVYSDWQRIIQSDVEFDRTEISRNGSEIEFEFDMPKVYTQTRL